MHFASHPTAAARLVDAVNGTEFAVEIDFFTGDHAIANDEIERHQHDEHPKIIEANCQTGLAQEHADVDRVAGQGQRMKWLEYISPLPGTRSRLKTHDLQSADSD